MKNGAYYGIDFGTTNTSVYLYNYEQGRGSRETGYGTDGKDLTPFSSCIAISKTVKNDFKFGREVKERINEYADDYRIITSFKSLLGTDEEIVVNGVRYTGKVLVALFLKHVKETVRRIRPDFNEAVFSIPVDFSARARTELLEAAERVGIKVKGFVSESSSAYISKVKDIKAFSKVMVIDFGGGTLDLSILNLKHNQVFEDAVYGIKFGGDDIDRYPKPWLPAVELTGEGIFIRFNKDRVTQWRNTNSSRYRRMKKAMEDSKFVLDSFSETYVMLHTFAHLFIREITNICGYSAASIREKIYSEIDDKNEVKMCGVLIYVSSSDSDSSLGGLISIADNKDVFEEIIDSMLERASWCSGDPLCISSMKQGYKNLNYAACHDCTLLPETSCERFNCFLDRASIVGLPDNPDLGFFK